MTYLMWAALTAFVFGLAAGETHAAPPDSVEAGDSVAVAPSDQPPAIAREFRGTWISPVGGAGRGDWPSAPGLSADSQKAELRTLLDQAKAIGLNAIILHVRTAADALYPTSYAPWSAFLTGMSGGDPGYDPLAFAVTEAHARGLQLHAWFNPFRAMLPNFEGRAAPTHITRTHPEWIRRYGSQTWIDPGEPAARALIIATIMDVVRRYDVDGVHLDDYFYPYRESETVQVRTGRRHKTKLVTRDIPFPDEVTWQQYGMRQGASRADWRRDNVNALVHDLYAAVKAEKPWVLVGISPFGIWRPGSPAGITGLDSYEEIYADSRRWLEEGWVDYLAPQLYWPLDGVEERFVALDSWWRQQNPRNRYVWPGLETANLRTGRWAWDEIAKQITTLRQERRGTSEAPGHVHFRLGSLSQDDGILGDELRQHVYQAPALVPAFPWLAPRGPGAPRAVVLDSLSPQQFLVAPGDSVPVAWWLVQRQVGHGRWTAALFRATDAPFEVIVPAPEAQWRRVAVRAIGRTGEAGPVRVLQADPRDPFWRDCRELPPAEFEVRGAVPFPHRVPVESSLPGGGC